MKTDGSDETVIAAGCHLPDGIAIDTRAGHVYWTNMGVPSREDGSIERADLDGKNRTIIVPVGGTFTPSSAISTGQRQALLVRSRGNARDASESRRLERRDSRGHEPGRSRPGPEATKWCVGITLDPARGHMYWTQKGPDNGELGRIFRAGIDAPRGEKPAHRSDIEVLFERLPEPIDLELDLEHRVLYWTDRGDPPRGNTVNRAPIDGANHGRAGDRDDALDGGHRPRAGRSARPDVRDRLRRLRLLRQARWLRKQMFLFAKGNLTGVTYAEIAAREK